MKCLFFVLILLSCVFISEVTYPIPADVEKLSGPDCFPAIDKTLNEANKSIFVVMYYIEYKKETPRNSSVLAMCKDNQEKQEGKVYTLLSDLVRAKERGVSVSVILDRTTIFKRDAVKGKRMSIDGKNMPAFYFLKRHGVDVKFDSVDIYTHGKCVVVDGEIVILGSHNWTNNSFTRSNEYSILIRSKELAEGLLADFYKIQIDYEASKREAEEYVELSEDILINVLGKFVSASNDYCWNVYLYLVGYCAECRGQSPTAPLVASADIAYKHDNKELNFDYKAVAEYLGIFDKPAGKRYRETLTKTLKQLDEKYELLEYIPVWNKNAQVKLKVQEGNKIEVPKKFWDYGWDKRLSLSAQFCYFVNLVEGGQSHREWTMNKEKLIKKYRVGKDVFSGGMAELRHWNIVQIVYGIVRPGQSYGTRQVNRYRLKDLYKLEDFEVELQKLYDKYGKDKVEGSRELAEIISCENNLAEIEETIRLIDEYGKDKVLAAFNKVAPWDKDNPKRSMAYVKGILKTVVNYKW